MSEPLPPAPLQTPRVVEAPARTIAGLTGVYDFDELAAIPAQWRSFQPWFGNIPEQVGYITYGVCFNYRQRGIVYLCGVEVGGTGKLPEGINAVKTSAGRYAVFEHRGHASGIRNTWCLIYDAWMPASGLTIRHQPAFERMDERFNGATSHGVVEIWIPIV